MQSLENQLRLLFDAPAERQSQDIVNDIKHVCFQEVPIHQLGFLCSMVFRSEYSVLNYLEQSVISKEQKLFAKTREGVLVFLSELLLLVKKYNQNISDYLFEIKNTLVSLFRKEESNVVRSAVFLPLQQLFRIASTYVDIYIEQLQIPQLADLFLNEYAYGKCLPTVKANILKFEGLLLKKFPQYMQTKVPSIQSLYVETLKSNFTSKKPDMSAIAAALMGVEMLLFHFAANFTSNPNTVQMVYKYVCFGLEPPPSLTRYHIPKAALKVISNHSNVFKEYLTEDSERMFIRITNLCKHQNKSVMFRAFRSLDAFYQSVAHELVGSARSEDSNVKTFKFFIRKFFEIIDSPTGTPKEISIAIRGFGKFSGAALRYMGGVELKKLCSKLFQFSERFFAGTMDQFEEAAHHLPSFISSFALLMMYMDSIEDVYLDHLEKLISAVFVFYPKLMAAKRQDYNEALSRLFISLFSKGATLQTLLSRIVFQGLVLTCTSRSFDVPSTPNAASSVAENNDSSAASADKADGEEEDGSKPVVKSLPQEELEPPFVAYKELWEVIIDPVDVKDMDLPPSKKNQMCSIIYSQFLMSIISIIKKLNLGYQISNPVETDDRPLISTDPSAENATNLIPLMPKDYDIFLNLVDFCRKILLIKKTELFMDWVYVFGKDIIKLSNQFPLVSGFYKLLTTVMRLCEKHGYFDDHRTSSAILNHHDDDDDDDNNRSSNVNSDMEIENNNNNDDGNTRNVCYALFSKFIREVLGRIQQYKNELLTACIHFLLSVPKQFVDVKLLLPALQSAFKIGLSYIGLANAGLSALERWMGESPSAVVENLPLILPSLNEYLRMDTKEYDEKITSKLENKFKFKVIGRSKGFEGKFLVKSKAMKLQTRILRFLGRLGGNNTLLATEGDSSKSTEIEIVWDTVPRISFFLPFTNMKPSLFLDSFMPRIVQLAETSQDRQLKVAACELFHSIILFMVGASAFKSADHNIDTQFYKLYEHIFPAMIRLSTDVETVAKQLFKPLTIQLINWFTKNINYENTETMTLLDAIINAVGNPNDGALRDFSAKCLAQFLESSLRNTKNIEHSEEKPTNVKSLFKRLYSLARHPDPFKRLGCALTLNQSYKIFREHHQIVEIYIFELIHHAIFSLRLSHQDDPSIGTSEQMSIAIKNLNRIITVYAKDGKLITVNKKRREHQSLEHFVNWLFEQTTRPERLCRNQCMSLFITLSSYLSNIRSAKEWLQRNLQLKSINWFFDVFEPTPYQPLQIRDSTSYSKLLSYFIQVETLLDVYHWIIRENLIDPKLIFDSNLDLSSHIFSMIEEVFESCAFLGATRADDGGSGGSSGSGGDLLSHLTSKSKSPMIPSFIPKLSPHELEVFNSKKTLLLYRCFSFIQLLLSDHPSSPSPSSSSSPIAKLLDEQKTLHTLFSKAKFYEALILSMLTPSLLGFNLNDKELNYEDDVLPTLSTLTSTLKLKLTSHQLTAFQINLKKILSHNQLNLSYVVNSSSSSSALLHQHHNVQSITSLISGYRVLYQSDLLSSYLADKRKQHHADLADHLCGSIFDTNLLLCTPTQLVIFSQVLELSFTISSSPNTLLQCLLDQTPLSSSSSSSSLQMSGSGGEGEDDKKNHKATKGNVFYQKFSSLIISHLIQHFETYVEVIMKHIESHPLLLQVINDVIETTIKLKHPQTTLLIDQHLTKHLHHLKHWYSLSTSPIYHYYLLDFLKKFLKLNPSSFSLSTDGEDGDDINIEGDDSENDQKITFILNAFISLMDKSLSLSFKLEVLDLLPTILLLPQHKLQTIKAVLNDMIIYNFPVKSHDLPKNSTIFSEVIKTIDKLLDALILSKNPLIIDVLLPVIREEDHVHATKINTSFVSFTNHLTDKQAIQAFNLSYNIFLEESHQDQLRLAIVKKICIPILANMSISTISDIFNKRVIKLMEIISVAVNPAAYIETTEIINKISAYLFIKAMYDYVPAKTIREMINSTYVQSQRVFGDVKGNELTTAIMKAAHTAKSKSLSDSTIPPSLYVEFHSVAYNALASVVAATQTKENFFHLFFFKENPEKNELIWANIVNVDENYNFEVETKFPLLIDQTEQIKKAKEENNKTPQSHHQHVQYISSQYLADTSLSQDMSYMASLYETSQHNFDISTNRPKSAKYEEITSSHSKDAQTADGNNQSGGELELDVINSNLCMPSILKLIDLMMKMFGDTYKALAVNQMPGWIKEIHQTLSDLSTSYNIKLFLLKIIINRPQVFERYASQFLDPILQIANSPSMGKGFHYYLRDICLLLILKWRFDHQQPQRSLTASEQSSSIVLFSHLIQNLNYKNDRFIWKSNLDLIKMFVERWKDCFQFNIISPSKRIILNLITFDEKNSKDKIEIKLQRITGMQLLGILISNGYPFYDHLHDSSFISEQQYYDLICSNLQRQAGKELYSITSEVCGLIMNKLYSSQPPPPSSSSSSSSSSVTPLSGFPQVVKEKINVMLNSLEMIDGALVCLRKIALHYSAFLDHFYLKIFNLLPKLIGEYRIIGLQLVLERAENIGDLLKNIRPLLEKLLIHRDVEAQSLTLQIFLKLLPQFSLVDLEKYLNLLTTIFATSNDEKCRELYYEILIWMYENHDEMSENDVLRIHLLKGLCDSSELISSSLLKFWNHPHRLSSNIVDRLMQTMSCMYDPSVETAWLRYSSHLLLQSCYDSPDFNLALYNPLTDSVQFHEYQIDYSWQNRSMPMSPLFSSQSLMMMSSQDMEIDDVSAPPPSSSSSSSPLSPPRKPNRNNNNNSQSSSSSSSDHKVKFTPTPNLTSQSTEKSGGLGGGRSGEGSGSQFAVPSSTYDPKAVRSKLLLSSTFSSSSLSSSLFSPSSQSGMNEGGGGGGGGARNMRIPRRFLKSEKILHPSQVTGNSYSFKAFRDRQKNEQRLKQMRDRRQYHIKMFRTYRTGELPDIQIKPKEIILPLQALVDRDPLLSRLFFTEIFKSIFQAMTNEKERQKRKLQAQDLIVDLLTRSSQYTAPFVGCLQWICYGDQQIFVNPDLVYTTSSHSHNYHTGILFLEKQILTLQTSPHLYHDYDANSGGGGGGGGTTDLEEQSWIKLIGLYKLLGDEDILLGLYEKHYSQSKNFHYTKKAINYELKGDYKSALYKYEEALTHYDESSSSSSSHTTMNNNDDDDEDDHHVSHLLKENEAELWGSNRMECLVKLLMWNDLLQNTLEEVESCTEQLWDIQHRVPFLSYYLTSLLKQKQTREMIFQFIDQSLSLQPTSTTEEIDLHRSILESEFLPEMTLTSILRDDYDKANYYISTYYSSFLKKWSTIHPLATTSRKQLLRPLQWMVEMDEFLYFSNVEKNVLCLSPLQSLLSKWSSRFPSITSDINVWDDIIQCRTILYDKLYEKFVHFIDLQSKSSDPPPHPSSSTTTTSTTSSSPHDVDYSISKVKEILLSEKMGLRLNIATTARKQNNLLVSEYYLKLASSSLKSTSKSMSSKQFSFPFFTSLVKLYTMKAKQEKNVEKFIVALQYINEKKNEDSILSYPLHQQRFYVLQADVYNELSKLAQADPKLITTTTSEYLSALKLKLPSSSSSSSSSSPPIDIQLSSKAFHYYKMAIDIIRSTSSSPSTSHHDDHHSLHLGGGSGSGGSGSGSGSGGGSGSGSGSGGGGGKGSGVAKSYLKYATFTDDLLKASEKLKSSQSGTKPIDDDDDDDDGKKKKKSSSSSSSSSTSTLKEYAEIIITNTLDAISLAAARDRLPRLLHLLGQFPSTRNVFKEKVKSVPVWMFLRWIPQMMGLLDKPEGPYILPTLLSIAIMYPQAIIYPFKISSEKYTSTTRKLVMPLMKRLSHAMIDDMIHALEKLTHPEHRFKDWVELLKPHIKAADQQMILSIYKQMYHDLCDKSPTIGSYNRKFAENWQNVFISKFGKYDTASKLIHLDLKSFIQVVGSMNEKMNAGMTPHGTAKMKLAEFNIWLADYDISNQLLKYANNNNNNGGSGGGGGDDDHGGMMIEVPGQYHGLSVPLIDHHIKIASIDSDLLVMGSLRKPKRIKLRGNDQRDHPFLVKGGEDLRLDQRVQQLFMVMNQIFKNDPSCTRRSLFLPTYQVIPMTSKVGMIEWIDNTKPLKALIEAEIAAEVKKNASEVSIQRIEAAKIHETWLKKYSNSSRLSDIYDAMFEKASRSDCIRKFDKQMQTVSWGLLRSGVMSLSASPEAYLSIRSRFTRSLATFSIGSYIIGIGDRHLENFLLNYQDGGLVGIDFGHAFGTATQFLPIPELVPFRLTRQFTNFLLPLDSKGLLNHNMIHCLRALQQNKDILLNTMNVFITEPLIDWEKLARRCAREQGSDGNTAWFPEEKLKIVLKKLSGYNPAHILVEELRTSVHGSKPVIKKLEVIVRGVPHENVRADFGKKCSVTKQVEALVDLATDPNVLGRMYGGWASWI